MPKLQKRIFANKIEFCFKVSNLAGAMSELGVKKGDRVMIYMPMVPQVSWVIVFLHFFVISVCYKSDPVVIYL